MAEPTTPEHPRETDSPTGPAVVEPTDAGERSPVSVVVEGAVATVRLASPETMNSVGTAMKAALKSALRALADDPAVRCVVLTGSGRAFCVGQDLKEHVAALQSGSGDLGPTVRDDYNPIVELLATMPKPVIAAVNGVAAGAGVSFALACDLRVMAAGSGMNFAFAGIALSCDSGTSWSLPRLVGLAKAKELVMLPRTIPATECLALGLATRVVPVEELEQVVRELAEQLAQGPTLAYAALRRSLAYGSSHELSDTLAREAEHMSATGATEDHRAAVEAFVAKEKPTFRGR